MKHVEACIATIATAVARLTCAVAFCNSTCCCLKLHLGWIWRPRCLFHHLFCKITLSFLLPITSALEYLLKHVFKSMTLESQVSAMYKHWDLVPTKFWVFPDFIATIHPVCCLRAMLATAEWTGDHCKGWKATNSDHKKPQPSLGIPFCRVIPDWMTPE